MKTLARTAIAVLTISASAQLAMSQTRAPATASEQGQDEVQTDPDPYRGFFEANLSDGGSYMVALRSITSIARHNYIVDGAVRVSEVSVSAQGAIITRFYHLEPITDGGQSTVAKTVINRVKSTTKEIAKRTGTDDALTTVTKNYPTTTHSRNVEFRLKEKANVDQLYNALHKAWFDNKGTKVSVRTKK